MDKNLKLLSEKVLKRETKEFLNEIENLIIKEKAGEAIVNDDKKKENSKALGRSQFKMLLDSVPKASCIEELLLFISYQKARGNGWNSKCRNGESIADNLVESFMKIQNKIYPEILNEPDIGEISSDDERLLRLDIAEKYMGYLFWKAYAVSK